MHLRHKFENKGWKMWGDSTQWFYKCHCGAEVSTFVGKSSINELTPVGISTCAFLITIIWFSILYVISYI